MIVADSTGATVLTLGDHDLVGGYLVTLFEQGDRTFDEQTASSPFVHGEFAVSRRLVGATLTLSVLIEGTDWDDVCAKREALLDAVEAPRWLLRPSPSVTWACRTASSSSPLPPNGADCDYREVTLTIPAAPSRGA